MNCVEWGMLGLCRKRQGQYWRGLPAAWLRGEQVWNCESASLKYFR